MRLLLATLLAAFFTTQASAIPLNYYFEGRISGELGGTTFTDTAFSLTFNGNTDNLTGAGTELERIRPISWPKISIDGFDIARVTDPSLVGFNDDVDVLFIGGTDANDYFDVNIEDGFNIAAVSGPTTISEFEFTDLLDPVETTQGLFQLTGLSEGTLTISNVPLPGGLVLMLSAVGVIMLRRAV